MYTSISQSRGIIALSPYRYAWISQIMIYERVGLEEILGAPTGGRRDSTLVIRHGRENREARF